MSNLGSHSSIFLITGPVQGGKTTYLAALVEWLRKRGLKLGGFLSPGRFEEGERSGFILQNTVTGMELPMASASETGAWIKYRRFWFNPEAFKKGREWILESLREDPDVMVIDEVGPMELEGSGWLESLESLQTSSIPVQLWNVREPLIAEVAEKWDIPGHCIIHIDKAGVNQAGGMIAEEVKKQRIKNQAIQ